MKRFWVEVTIVALGIGIAIVAYRMRKRGDDRGARMVEAEHIELSTAKRLKVIQDSLALLEASGEATKLDLDKKMQEIARVEANATAEFKAKGLSADTIAVRFSRMHRGLSNR